MLRKIFAGFVGYCFFLISCFYAPFVNAVGMPSMRHIYNLAKKEDVKALKEIKSMIDTIGDGGNSALCQSIINRDYKSFYTLKTMGASARHPCVNKISSAKISQFNQGYNSWVLPAEWLKVYFVS